MRHEGQDGNYGNKSKWESSYTRVKQRKGSEKRKAIKRREKKGERQREEEQEKTEENPRAKSEGDGC